MMWNVSNTKRKSLLERLVNVEETSGDEEQESAFEESPVATMDYPEPVFLRDQEVVTPEKSLWRNLIIESEPVTEEEVEETVEEVAQEEILKQELDPTVPRKVFITSQVEEEPEAPRQEKYFDILERAKEIPDERREEIKLEYTIPKHVYPDFGRKEEEFNTALSDFAEKRAPSPFENLYEKVALSDELVEENAPVTYPDFSPTLPQEMPQSTPAQVDSIVVEEQPVILENQSTGEQVQVQRQFTLDKIVFPEEYFYAKNGSVIRTIPQLRDALHTMDDETFNHHAVIRNTNDFANWVRHVYSHHEAADRLSQAQTREEMLGVIDSYL